MAAIPGYARIASTSLATDFWPIVGDDAAYFVLADQRTVLCFDPLSQAERFRLKLVADSEGALVKLRAWPSDTSIMLACRSAPPGYKIRLHDKNGAVTFDDPALFSEVPQAIDSDGIIYGVAGTGGGNFSTFKMDTSTTGYTGYASVTPQLTAHYYLSNQSNAVAVPSGRIPTVAIAKTAVYVAQATPLFATNSHPQTLRLSSYSRDLSVLNWTIPLCSNLSLATDVGCDLGGIHTDDSGFIYATYRYPNTRAVRKWYLAIFDPAAGRLVTPEIQVPGPGYPQPSSVQGSKLRYVSVLRDMSSAVTAYRPNWYYKFDEGTTAAGLRDNSGSGLNGTYAGSAVLGPSLLPGDPNDGAFVLDGSTASASVASNALFHPGLGSYTWDFVLKTTNNPGSPVSIFSKTSNDTTAADGVLIQHYTSGIQVLIWGSTVNAPASIRDGISHKVRVVLDRTGGTPAIRVYVDSVLAGSGSFAGLSGINISNASVAYIGRKNGGSFFNGTIDEIAGYPVALPAEDFQSLVSTGPDMRTRYLDALQGAVVTSVDLAVQAQNDFVPTAPVPYSPYKELPTDLLPQPLTQGGVFEVFEKRAGELVRLAFANDMLSGLVFTPSLLSLDRLTFNIPFDRFSPAPTGSGATLRELQRSWRAAQTADEFAPYDKPSLVQDHVYVRYTEVSGRQRLFRVTQLQHDEPRSLSGEAVDAAVELADYMTHYRAGRSQFQGELPSAVAQRILQGDESLAVTNRRFVPDKAIRFNLGREVPDMTPASVSGVVKAPMPYATDLMAATPNDVALFSGLPHETVPADGTAQTLPTGLIGYQSFTGTAGFFNTHAVDTAIAGPLNHTSATPLLAGEASTNMSRIYYGAIKTTLAGKYLFRVVAGSGLRVFFRYRGVFDTLTPATAQTAAWSSDLEAGKWYPFVIHLANSSLARAISFFWTVPGQAEVIIPASNLSAQLHGGLVPVRLVDNSSVVRYLQCFKRWDGKGLVVGVPTSSIFPQYMSFDYHWPKSMQPGTLVEEISFPLDRPQGTVYEWGSGWTRRPGASYRQLPAVQTAKFQARARTY